MHLLACCISWPFIGLYDVDAPFWDHILLILSNGVLQQHVITSIECGLVL